MHLHPIALSAILCLSAATANESPAPKAEPPPPTLLEQEFATVAATFIEIDATTWGSESTPATVTTESAFKTASPSDSSQLAQRITELESENEAFKAQLVALEKRLAALEK